MIDNTEEKTAAAIKMADEFINDQNIDRKKAIHLRLAAEETVGMIRSMSSDLKALFWMEKDEDGYKVRLSARMDMDRKKKRELLSVSSSGQNAARKGFMGKIRELIENGTLSYDEIMKQQQLYGGVYMGYGLSPEVAMGGVPYAWSLSQYKGALADSGKAAAAERDELEKSIVANIADEVIVGVEKDRVEMTIVIA